MCINLTPKRYFTAVLTFLLCRVIVLMYNVPILFFTNILFVINDCYAESKKLLVSTPLFTSRQKKPIMHFLTIIKIVVNLL